MLRFRLVCGAGILLALAIVGIAWFTNAATATSVKPPAPPPVHRAFQISQTYLAGDPAIHPHLAQNGSGPAFTQDDVIAFFNTNGFFAGPVVPGAHLKILTIQFVTARQASQLMRGESVGRPDNALVCYVKVQGPFLLTNIRGAPPRPNVKAPTTAEYGDAVFDAHTGNLLIWGVYYQ
ncbi:MAG TPA: hypothetical protein VFA09_18225 [Ktedonobacteraceae bacterium]|nr:hypothetical protein [Ktedonobacteraceae bacterium]